MKYEIQIDLTTEISEKDLKDIDGYLKELLDLDYKINQVYVYSKDSD